MADSYKYDPVGQPQGLMAKGFALAQDLTGDPLMGVSSLRFIQRVDWFECLCPCFGETTNYYRMTSSDPIGKQELQEVGIIQESSECCARFCCQQWRPWKQMFLDSKNEILFESQRKYKIPAAFCCPCVRPEIDVMYKEKKIGQVKQPYMFCGRSPCPCPLLAEIDINDENDNTIYYVSGQFCQCGQIARLLVLCRCCGPCQFINFDIYSPSKEKVGQIRNMFEMINIPSYNGACYEMCTKADKFVIDFPNDADFKKKILLINAVLTIDYDLFESTCGNLP